MNKKLLVGIAGAVVIAVAGFVVFSGGGASAAAGTYAWDTVAVGKGDVARVVSASGTIQPREKVEVGSEVSGRITAIYVDFNDKVTKNQVLAQVDPETFQNTLDQNIARLRQAEASVDNSKAAIDRSKVGLEVQTKAYERTRTLYTQGATSTQQMEQAEQAWKNARLQLQSDEVSLKSSVAGAETARASVQDARTRLERTKIRSPIDGVILARQVEVGQTVQSAQTVAKFFTVAADLSLIKIEAAVVESDIGGINNGDPVVFTVDAFPGERFNGSVVQVRQLGAEAANVVTYTVVINARNPNGKLLPGMTANVEITADRVTDVLRLPYDVTRFQPPKEIADAMREEAQRSGAGDRPGAAAGGPPASGGSAPGGGGGQGGQRGFGGPGGPQAMFGEMLRGAGVDEARTKKIEEEMQTEMRKLFASMGPPGGAPSGGVAAIGGGGFGPPQAIVQQQQRSERMAKMQQIQDAVFRRNLSEAEYAAVSKARQEMQTQKRATVYTVDDKGKLERKMITIGLSDGSNVQVIRGAKEGDKFVVRVASGDKAGQKP